MRIKDLKSFIEKAKIVHNNFYNYELFIYINSHYKSIVICPVHGQFLVSPNNHLRNRKCPKCGIDIIKKKQRFTTEQFIEKAKLIYGNKYDYSKVEYINAKTKVKIICPIHGEFEQVPDSHLKNECKKCSTEITKEKLKFSIEDVLERFKSVHGNRYDYSKVEYVNVEEKVKIVCPIHGEFEQIAKTHMLGFGCPRCNESRGEKEIAKILTEMNISFERQKKFEDCKNKLSLPFDFYIPSKNIAIEFQGIQHYEIVKFFGGEEGLKKVQHNDKIKEAYCLTKNIKLVIIPYWDLKNIEKKLKEIIC